MYNFWVYLYSTNCVNCWAMLRGALRRKHACFAAPPAKFCQVENPKEISGESFLIWPWLARVPRQLGSNLSGLKDHMGRAGSSLEFCCLHQSKAKTYAPFL